jgi:putative drug exporter of the RND superfamily
MNPIQRLATFVAGRRTKQLTLVFWLIVVAIVGSLAGQLNGAEKNDSTAWLPSGAESTAAHPGRPRDDAF